MRRSQFDQVDLYEVLGIPVSALSSEVSSAYRHAARRTHPDKGGSAEAFHLTTLAFEVLSCPVTRKIYDKQQMHFKEQQCMQNLSFKDSFLTCRHPEYTTPVCQTGRKRRRMADLTADFDRVTPKHQCCDTHVAMKLPSWQARVNEALANLQSVLQSMEVDSRCLAIKKLPSRIRSTLLCFMEDNPTASVRSHRLPKSPCVTDSYFMDVGTKKHKGVATLCILHSTKYQARIRIKGLRLYTQEQVDLETAVEHQILLARLRHEIASETVLKHEAWLEPQQLAQKCLQMLSQHNVTEESLGLRCFLEFRASPWCGSRRTISTPTYKSLQQALQINARLLRARATSWESLRSEWIQLLMIPRRGQPKRISLQEAASIVDAARFQALQQRLEKTVCVVQTALAHKQQKMMQAHRLEKKRSIRMLKAFWKLRRKLDKF